jgi:hypothetical protein
MIGGSDSTPTGCAIGLALCVASTLLAIWLLIAGVRDCEGAMRREHGFLVLTDSEHEDTRAYGPALVVGIAGACVFVSALIALGAL